MNEKDFRRFVKEILNRFDVFVRNVQLNNEISIASKVVDKHDRMKIVEEILNEIISNSIDVSLNNDEELIIVNVFDRHDELLLIVQDES